ncbi:hypothetical protein MP228_007821 [Amoeboaphelidium protococcarum]|nr:hypothetical protein MP228_007821 [Amoeboaphelidium protococcarum]
MIKSASVDKRSTLQVMTFPRMLQLEAKDQTTAFANGHNRRKSVAAAADMTDQRQTALSAPPAGTQYISCKRRVSSALDAMNGKDSDLTRTLLYASPLSSWSRIMQLPSPNKTLMYAPTPPNSPASSIVTLYNGMPYNNSSIMRRPSFLSPIREAHVQMH